MDSSRGTIFSALSTSARQLYLLLRCISFTPKVEVHITREAIRFSAEEARTIQGLTSLERSLFSTFTFNPAAAEASRGHDDDHESTQNSSIIPTFQISLPALLETLQIFGISDSSSSSSYRNAGGGFSSSYATAFNTPALALNSSGGTCRISYASIGAPLSITISEGGVTTTCELTTYESAARDYIDDVIPLQLDALTFKVIMRSTWLHDAMTELANTNPTILVLSASATTAPYFALEGHGGPFGDSTVDFTPTSAHSEPNTTTSSFANTTASSRRRGKRKPLVTETFAVVAPPGSHGRVRQRYKFDLVQKAARAMAAASKVSIRCDQQGVLSLQFMIEVGGGAIERDARVRAADTLTGRVGGSGAGVSASNPANTAGEAKISFVDFRFVPLVDEDDDDDDEGDSEDQEVADYSDEVRDDGGMDTDDGAL